METILSICFVLGMDLKMTSEK